MHIPVGGLNHHLTIGLTSMSIRIPLKWVNQEDNVGDCSHHEEPIKFHNRRGPK